MTLQDLFTTVSFKRGALPEFPLDFFADPKMRPSAVTYTNANGRMDAHVNGDYILVPMPFSKRPSDGQLWDLLLAAAKQPGKKKLGDIVIRIKRNGTVLEVDSRVAEPVIPYRRMGRILLECGAAVLSTAGVRKVRS